MSCEVFDNDPIEVIFGCTDPLATNYNPSANTDDGSCVYNEPQPISGCTNPLALNYDENATVDDGSCFFFDFDPEIPVNLCLTSFENITLNEDGTVTETSTGNNLTNTCCENLGTDRWFYEDGVCYWKQPEPEPSILIELSETDVVIPDNRCDSVDVCLWVYFEEPDERCLGTEQPVPNRDDCNGLVPIRSNADGTVDFGNPDGTDPVRPVEISPSCCASYGYVYQDGLCRSDIEAIPPINVLSQIEISGLPSGATQTVTQSYSSDADGFCEWVQICTEVQFPTTPVEGQPLEFELEKKFKVNLRIDGILDCCDYDVRVDDIQVNCTYQDTVEVTNENDCPGFELRRVIDNKKSWAYNDGEQLNRIFAPSPDADLAWRYTDYKEQSNIYENHSKLVLNSKELDLTFNFCDAESRGDLSIFDLIEYKKVFQNFWVRFMEQFIPATTIFVSGEKWCTSDENICPPDPCVYDNTITQSNLGNIEIVANPTPVTPPTQNGSVLPDVTPGTFPSGGGDDSDGDYGDTTQPVIQLPSIRAFIIPTEDGTTTRALTLDNSQSNFADKVTEDQITVTVFN